MQAALRARYSRRTRQIPDRTRLSERRRKSDHRFQRRAARLSAAQSPLSRNLLARREEYRGLEFIAAALARPCVPHAAFIKIFRPVGSEQPLAALGTMVLAVCGQAGGRRLGMQSHDSVLPEPEPPSARNTRYRHSVAAARQICVDTVSDSRKFALHCNNFSNVKIVRCAIA